MLICSTNDLALRLNEEYVDEALGITTSVTDEDGLIRSGTATVKFYDSRDDLIAPPDYTTEGLATTSFVPKPFCHSSTEELLKETIRAFLLIPANDSY